MFLYDYWQCNQLLEHNFQDYKEVDILSCCICLLGSHTFHWRRNLNYYCILLQYKQQEDFLEGLVGKRKLQYESQLHNLLWCHN